MQNSAAADQATGYMKSIEFPADVGGKLESKNKN